MGELRYEGVAVWGSCGMGELRCGGVALLGSCGVGELRYKFEVALLICEIFCTCYIL